MALEQEHKEWITKAIEKGLNKKEVKKKLEEAGIKRRMKEEMLQLYDEMITINTRKQELEEPEEDTELEEIMSRLDKGEELSKEEEKIVKDYAKSISKVLEATKKFLNDMRKITEATKARLTKEEQKKSEEIEKLRIELIDRLLDSKQYLYLIDPITGEEATKKSLQEHDVDTLIKMFEENIEEMELFVNGKVAKL